MGTVTHTKVSVVPDGTDTNQIQPSDWNADHVVSGTFAPSAHNHPQSDVTNLTTDLAAKAPLASPTFTGDPKAPTPAAADNDTSIATTAWVQTEIAAKAPLASPTFTGDPKAPTPAAADNDTSIATTAWVQTEIAAKAPLASPALTGNPTAPTATAGDNDTSIATTAFVHQAKRSEVVTALTDGATPALDASLGNMFTLTAAGNRTIAVPSNPTNGQKIVIIHLASGADRTLALNTGAGGFRFGTTITALSATTSGKKDYIGAIYNGADSKWDVVAYSKGF